ncbi:hypothetical protein HPB50_000439 [Hyalomma asiaticum]|uniref:Uncharacterized protein n=1 Tax=Hyalomma asiaticum TaxID=266040 RepID=A0ACB7RN92_HYAAI|nr:hypothetical protein HPB50_000439 [Hyalomma asiaticum]
MDWEVEGESLPPEAFSEASGWQTVVARRSRAKSAHAERVAAIPTGVTPDENVAAQGRRDHSSAKVKIIRGARMPPLPKDDAKIIVRPAGGLNIRKVGPTVVAEARRRPIAPQRPPRAQRRSSQGKSVGYTKANPE